MVSKTTSGMPNSTPAIETALRELLGYLNFSGGKPDAGFRRNWNAWHSAFGIERPLSELKSALGSALSALKAESPAFAECEQAHSVIGLAFDSCLPAYRQHHADLLFHLADTDFQQPFFLAKVFEAILAQGGPWTQSDRIVSRSLDRLNDFLGYRPVAVLENGRKTEPYDHERIALVPLYFREVGTAAGKYHALIDRTMQFFTETPVDAFSETHFDLARLDELSADVRAYDHVHPVNRRTNYTFGEWDPHCIDLQGYYRRFVLRKIILDGLLKWMSDNTDLDHEELLYDASAVLCGTILMAATISGSGPTAHDSNVTLASLLPKVARQRDAFYERLLQNAQGARAKRLRRIADLTQQPFGHVRQYVNMHLSSHGAKQVQHRQLAELYARMGFFEASRRHAWSIPSASARFECEMRCRLTAVGGDLDRADLDTAAKRLTEVQDLFQRGIRCGALMDPWNFLGFQAQFPLFASREDSIPDQRALLLLEIVEQTFRAYSRALGEASALGDNGRVNSLSQAFLKFGEQWDRYATGVVNDLPEVSGGESWASATRVAQVLSKWREAGESAGDISFWRQHADQFDTAKAYALVVASLLAKRDRVAAIGLLMQWLSEAEDFGIGESELSITALLGRWLDQVCDDTVSHQRWDEGWPHIRRLFELLEANAGELWQVPRLEELLEGAPLVTEESLLEEELPNEQMEDEEDSSEDWLYQAAYDDVVYRDSATDGNVDDTLEVPNAPGDTEFEGLSRILEPRIEFLATLARLWQQAAAVVLTRNPSDTASGPGSKKNPPLSKEQVEVILEWAQRAAVIQKDLSHMLKSIWAYDVPLPSADYDSSLEYDLQLQVKFHLLQQIIGTLVSLQTAERLLIASLPHRLLTSHFKRTEQPFATIYRAVMRRDRATVRRLLPALCDRLARKPLLYVPFENDGRPEEVLAARQLHSMLQFLLVELPRLGLLRETWHVLQTAFRMEKGSRPRGRSVTEFDRLLQHALRSSLESLIRSSETWQAGKFDDAELVGILSDVVEWYVDVWMKHSRTMRLSSVENLLDEGMWGEVETFVEKYGSELFHSRMITSIGHMRTILHNGAEWFLDELSREQDPLHPIPVLQAIEKGEIHRDYVVDMLELIYSTVVDKYDRFLEYNTTTTQSDYGEKLACLLDFLRVEAEYERDDWNLAPLGVAHEILCQAGKHDAARAWEYLVRERTADAAERHVKKLRELERTYGMRLPALSDRLSERFVRPMSVNRMLALVPLAAAEAKRGNISADSFAELEREVDEYLASTAGSGIDLPPWLQSLTQRVEEVLEQGEAARNGESPHDLLPQSFLNLREVHRQLKIWIEPLRLGKEKQ